MPKLLAHNTASGICCCVIGITITLGVFCKRVLYVAAYTFQSLSLVSLIGTSLWPRQSVKVRGGVGLVVEVVLEALDELEDGGEDEREGPEPGHVPHCDWQPAPQYAEEEPLG
jgi:hypothetical protein